MIRKTSLLIVDGYNILNAWGMAQKRVNLEAARIDLAEMLADYCGYKGLQAILVFDAQRASAPSADEKIGSLTLMYASPDETADSRIEGMMKEKLAVHSKVTVATADYALQLFVLGAGGLRMTPAELKLRVEQERGRAIE